MYILTRPRSHSIDGSNVETGPKLREDSSRQAFGKNVGELGRRRDVKNADSTKSHSFSDEVKINLNVLGTLMLNRVGRHVHGADIVAVDQCGMAQGCMQLRQQLAQPRSFGDSIGDRTILSFSTGASDRVLALGGLGNQSVTEEHCVG